MSETIRIRGLPRAVKQTRQLLPPIERYITSQTEDDTTHRAYNNELVRVEC